MAAVRMVVDHKVAVDDGDTHRVVVAAQVVAVQTTTAPVAALLAEIGMWIQAGDH